MRLREYLQRKLTPQVPPEVRLPTGYHVVGHVALLSLHDEAIEYAMHIGEAILGFDPRVRTVAIRSGPTRGMYREPSYVVVAGTPQCETVHIENGIRYAVNPLRLTFCGGNKHERIRLAKQVRGAECIVDMFACVGQFSLQVAAHPRTRVIAIEINPEACRYLRRNIRLNGFHNVSAVMGDCRNAHPIDWANRIIMGYLHGTIRYLPAALETLRREGGTVHMHSTLPHRHMDQTVGAMTRLCEEHGYRSDIEVRQVKKYAPGVDHFVFDIVASAA